MTRWSALVGEGPGSYPFDLDVGETGSIIRLRRLLEAIQRDLEAGKPAGEVGWRFHRTLAELVVAVCQSLADHGGPRTVALSGGCFQNRLLLARTVPRLEQAGFRVLLHRQVPCNDGGVSLGQAILAHFAHDRGGEHEVH